MGLGYQGKRASGYKFSSRGSAGKHTGGNSPSLRTPAKAPASAGNGGDRPPKGQHNTSKVRKKRRIGIAVVLILLAVTAIVAVYIKMKVAPPDSLGTAAAPSTSDDGVTGTELAITGSANRKSQFYTFLLCGTDEVSGNTDTIMAVSLDTANKKLYEVSIPRDTMINVTWSVKKINSAYPVGGIDELKKQVTKLLGYEVDNYVVVDLEAFQKIVDAIGGVDFNVPQNMDYDDPSQDLYIHVKAGMQHLDGKTALGVCRFRHGYATQDLGRINTQQLFIKALAKQLFQIQNVTKINELAKIMSEDLKTNLTYGNIVWLGLQMKDISADNITCATLSDGTDTYQGVSYSYVNVTNLLKTVNSTVNPYKVDITSGNIDVLTLVNGKPQATTGKVAGGSSSFYNSSSSSKSESEAVAEIPKETSKPSSSPKSSSTKPSSSSGSSSSGSTVSPSPSAKSETPSTPPKTTPTPETSAPPTPEQTKPGTVTPSKSDSGTVVVSTDGSETAN